MMKIGVIADTHIPERANEIPKRIYDEFNTVDLILHAGDLVTLDVLEELRRLAEVKAVYGNMDTSEVREVLPERQIIQVGRFNIGLVHGYGHPGRLKEAVKDSFKKGSIDCIVFGHSHRPLCEREKGLLLFNPGSPTDKIFSPFNSFGILEIGTEITGEIKRL